MHYWIPGTVFATLLLSGCSLWTAPETTTAQTKSNVKELAVPVGLKAPKTPAQYDIPAKVAAGVRGDDMELRAPMQVLAVSTNARVEEDDKEVRVFFERNEFTGDLMPFLTSNITDFFAEQKIELTKTSATSWQSGWVSEYEETGWWWWKSESLTQESRFNIEFEPRTHGRTVAVKVQLAGHKYADSAKTITPIAQRREEVHFLNRIIDKVATVELARIQEAKAKLPDVLLTRATNDKNEAVLLTTQSLEVAWTQLELLFEHLSLQVSDLNRTDYVYYVTFTKPEAGFWDALWGSEEQPVLPIAEGEYQLALSKTDKGTAIKWRDKNGNALDQATVDAIYEVFVATIRKTKVEL
ncbi:outer membrane protein assembly factor BamC [Rheinheimera sp.]|uniref:outer membrane protein assembly factor BamC n=1 Tax=Rheinheimera sp. TaxID=1869214 RepID=UPI0027BA3BB5|nr:outer membrane protein assembly factor BamC [Rheinheimera sp.]